MKRGTFETVEALDFRIVRHVQRAHAGDQHACADARAVVRGGVPLSSSFIPNGFVKTRIQADIRGEFVFLDAAFQVAMNLLLAGIHACPVGRGFEGEGIQMRRNVASAAGVAIVPPGAADVGALLDDQKRIHARFEKLDAHA